MLHRPSLIGLPFEDGPSDFRGAAGAPPFIREALCAPDAARWAERMVESGCAEAFDDLGDLAFDGGTPAREHIQRAVEQLADAGRPFIALGGDHSVTYSIVRGLSRRHRALTVLHLDAHADLCDAVDGNRYANRCTFARVMEERLVRRLVQVGLRALTAVEREQAHRLNVEQIDMRAWADGARPSTSGAVYVSIDLDAFDPAFAPGVSRREPGGLTSREVLAVLDTLGGELVGADIVEFNPARDLSGLTAALAAKLVRELAAQFFVESD